MKYIFIFLLINTVQYLDDQAQLEVEGDGIVKGTMFLDSGSSNIFFGNAAGTSLATGNSNVFLGIENGKENTEGHSNIFIGETAGEQNTTGSKNVFIGRHAGQRNKLGQDNVFIGRSAGTFYNPQGSNTSGQNVLLGATAGWTGVTHFQNTMIGFEAGFSATGSGNTFLGNMAGRDSGSGMRNVFIGMNSGAINGSGSSNTFVGQGAGANVDDQQGNTFLGASTGLNAGGNQNVFIGTSPGLNETDGGANVFIGSFAGGSTSSGGNNVLIGFQSSVTGSFSNCTALGYDTRCNATNKVRIGNDDVDVIEGAVLPTVASDIRLKKEIKENKLGLPFISKLRPVEYKYKKGRGDKFYTGLIAQEVVNAAASEGLVFTGVIDPSDESDFYSLRYTELIMPLINAVQELNAQNEALKSQLNELKNIVANPIRR